MRNNISLLIILTTILVTGCSQIQGTEVFNNFKYKDIYDYTVNCSANYNISLNNNTCITPKRAIWMNYNMTDDVWNNVCCDFDQRCIPKADINVNNVCNNVSTNFTYISPIFNPFVGGGYLCCNGGGVCYVDYISPNCNATNTNQTRIITISFNLTNTSQWQAICCVNGGY